MAGQAPCRPNDCHVHLTHGSGSKTRTGARSQPLESPAGCSEANTCTCCVAWVIVAAPHGRGSPWRASSLSLGACWPGLRASSERGPGRGGPAQIWIGMRPADALIVPSGFLSGLAGWCTRRAWRSEANSVWEIELHRRRKCRAQTSTVASCFVPAPLVQVTAPCRALCVPDAYSVVGQ